jgi:hypothetical protein
MIVEYSVPNTGHLDAKFSKYLSREPHVVCFTKNEIKDLCGKSDEERVPCFLILASDGLWYVPFAFAQVIRLCIGVCCLLSQFNAGIWLLTRKQLTWFLKSS